MLGITCQYVQFHPAIKFLIQSNPSALLWRENTDTDEILIREIADHTTHCVLMPWIATNYQWVLNDEGILMNPPVFCLIDQYANRGEATTGCTAAIIRQFFEAYPQGLA